MTFTSLGLCEPLTRAVAALGHEAPTPVQREAIPAVLAGRDVLACAPTGSGKTAAFLLPLLHALSAHPGRAPRQVRALVLVPTRELAAQISEAMGHYGRHLPRPLKSCLAVGGVSANPQMMALRGGADLVVATPGRAARPRGAERPAALLGGDAGARRGRPAPLARLRRRTHAPAGAAARPPAEPALLRDLPAGGADTRGAAPSRAHPHRRGGLLATCWRVRGPRRHRAARHRGGHGQAHAAAAPAPGEARVVPCPRLRGEPPWRGPCRAESSIAPASPRRPCTAS